MNLQKYTLDQLKEAIKNSYSYRQALKNLSVAPAGGNYTVIKKAIKHFNLDISHFKGRGWNKGKKFAPKQPLEYYYNQTCRINTYRLKNRLLKEGVFERKCYNCNLTTWLDNPIPLELDHINGNSSNNKLYNLTLLCPNCHALTPTYRGKNVTTHKA